MLISQMAKDGKINIVIGKDLSVLGHAERPHPRSAMAQPKNNAKPCSVESARSSSACRCASAVRMNHSNAFARTSTLASVSACLSRRASERIDISQRRQSHGELGEQDVYRGASGNRCATSRLGDASEISRISLLIMA